MTSHSGLWLTVLASVILIVGSVLFHYEMFRFLGRHILIRWRSKRRRVVGVVLLLMTLHIAEIWAFGVGYFLLEIGGVGRLDGLDSGELFEYVYYSAMVYTTVGFGDITPHGPLMLLTATEALAGLALITWSASFVFLEMSTGWKTKL